MRDVNGQIIDWNFGQANLPDTAFVGLVEQYLGVRVFADTGFHKSDKRGGDASNLIICGRGEENGRMLIETVFSLWANVLHLKKTTTRNEPHLEALLPFAVAAYNILINGTGKTRLETTFFSF